MTVDQRNVLRQGEISAGLASFRVVYASEFLYVWNSARRLGVAEADLPDLTHDIFVQALRSLPDYDAARPLRPWLFGIALRVVSGFRRLERHRREVFGQTVEAADPGEGATERLEAADDRRFVQGILTEMKLERRVVFIMYQLNGHSVREIATALGLPLPTVYTRLRLAMLEFGRRARRSKLLGGAP